MSNTEITQNQFADLQKYIPESDTVKMVFQDIVGHDIEDWQEAVEQMVSSSLNGDADALFDLLELTYLNAQNESMLGFIDETSCK